MWSSFIENKSRQYDKPILNIDKLSCLEEFDTAIDMIDHMLYVVLHPTAHLKKRSAVQETQRAIVESFEILKEEILSHPNYAIAKINAEKQRIQEQIKEQWDTISSDEQLLELIASRIPNDSKLTNKDDFLEKAISKMFVTQSFDNTIYYGEYERHSVSNQVIAVFDLLETLGIYVLIINSWFGSEEKHLYMCKIDKELCIFKKKIKWAIHFSPEYLKQKITEKAKYK